MAKKPNIFTRIGSTFIKTPGQWKTEAKTRKTKSLIRDRQAELRAMRGGHVAGFSSRAASSLASRMGGQKPKKVKVR